jgi:replicative DNA helicase
MVALFERGASIDYHTVAAELEHQGTLPSAGGLVGLAELNVATPTSTHITYYARIVADHALRRRFIGAAQHVAELAWDARQDIETVRQRSEALVLGAATDTLSGQEVLAPDTWTDHLLVQEPASIMQSNIGVALTTALPSDRAVIAVGGVNLRSGPYENSG